MNHPAPYILTWLPRRLCHLLLLLAWAARPWCVQAQHTEQPWMSWDDFVQDYLDEVESDDELWNAAAIDRLENLRATPLQLNRATRQQLLDLPFVSEAQADSLLAWRERRRGFRGLGELQLVRGIDFLTRQRLSLFVRTDSLWLPPATTATQGKAPATWRTMLTQGRAEVDNRFDLPLYRRRGYRPNADSTASRYLGGRWAHTLRLRYDYKRQLRYGLTMQKDAGEPAFRRGFYPYDYLSAYVCLQPAGRRWQLALGDYELAAGEALLLGRHDYAGAARLAQQPRRSEPALLRPHTSADEARYFRGAAFVWQQGAWRYAAFASWRKIDGRVNTDEGWTQITSLPTTGQHRTPSEVTARRQVGHGMGGLQVAWTHRRAQCALTAYAAHYEHMVNPSARYYNAYYFRGKRAAGASLSYRYTHSRWMLKGETALDHHLRLATSHLFSLKCGRRASWQVHHRYFAPRFVSLYGQAVRQGTRVANEHGVGTGLLLQASRKSQLRWWMDACRHHLPVYRANFSGAKQLETTAEGKHQAARRWTLGWRTRYTLQQRGLTGYATVPVCYHTLRLRAAATYASRRASIHVQADGAHSRCRSGEAGWGGMCLLRAGLKWHKHWLLKALGAWFATTDGQTALYAYEPQLPGAGAFPSFRYHGCRAVALLQWQPCSWVSAAVRASSTVYFNRTTISTGLEEIAHRSKQDVSVQLRLRW